MFRRSRRVPVARSLGSLCVCAGVTISATPAYADDAVRAKELFEQGREAVRGGDFERGCPLMLQSHELVPSIGALFNLALCDEHVGRLLNARQRWQRAIQLAKELADDRQAVAEERLRDLEGQIPTVEFVLARKGEVSKAPDDAIAELDGKLLLSGALGAPIEVDPGKHRIAITLSGQSPASVDFEVAAGDRITVPVPMPETPSGPSPALPPPEQPVESDDGAGMRAAGFVLVGVGAVSFVASAVTGAMYLSERSTVDDHCDEALLCDQEGFDAASSADSLGTINGVTFLVGAFAATAGLALVFLAPDGTEVQAKPAVGWSSGMLQVEGTF